jgi:hypothetical protein
MEFSVRRIRNFGTSFHEFQKLCVTDVATTIGVTGGGGGGKYRPPPPLYFLPKNNFHLVAEVKNGK